MRGHYEGVAWAELLGKAGPALAVGRQGQLGGGAGGQVGELQRRRKVGDVKEACETNRCANSLVPPKFSRARSSLPHREGSPPFEESLRVAPSLPARWRIGVRHNCTTLGRRRSPKSNGRHGQAR